jgi:hypothetical protein
MPNEVKKAKKDPKLAAKKRLIKARDRIRADLAKKFGRKAPK